MVWLLSIPSIILVPAIAFIVLFGTYLAGYFHGHENCKWQKEHSVSEYRDTI